MSRFTGTSRYIATADLEMAVNAAVTLGRPLLIKGEPGTGKTQLALEVATALERPILSGMSNPPVRLSKDSTNMMRYLACEIRNWATHA